MKIEDISDVTEIKIDIKESTEHYLIVSVSKDLQTGLNYYFPMNIDTNKDISLETISRYKEGGSKTLEYKMFKLNLPL